MTTAAPTINDPFYSALRRGEPDERLRSLRRWFVVLLIGGVIAGAILAAFVGPAVIRSGYANASPVGAINGAFDHRDQHPIEFYLHKWKRLSAAGLAGWVGFWLLVLVTTSQTFARSIVGKATPGTLGAIRVLTCLVLAWAVLEEPAAAVAKLGPQDRNPMGVMNFLYHDAPHDRGPALLHFDQLVKSESALGVYKALSIALLLVGTLGWKTRPVLIAAAICTIPLLGIQRSYSWLSHQGLLPMYVLVVLIFTRCADGWSIDRMAKLWRDEPVPPRDVPQAHYAWARHAIWAVIAMQYVMAALSKLFNESWRWWEGRNLQEILFRDGLRPGHGPDDLIFKLTWVPDWAFTFMGIMTIIVEAGMILVIVWSVARLIWPVMAMGMHVAIWLLQYIAFWDWIALLLVFYDWTRVRHTMGKWIARRHGSIDVLYDGRCAICRRSVRLLKGWDLLDRLNYLDFRTLDVAAYNAHRNVTLDETKLDQAMHVVARGRVTSGFAGCRTIASALPLFWITVTLLYLPGLSHAGAAGYRWLARNRMAFHTCTPDGACAMPGHAGAETSIATPRRGATEPADLPLVRKLLGPAVVTGIICFLLTVWVFRVEWYPFTSVQMFSSHGNQGVIEYYKCYATDAFKNTYEARLEDMGRGVSRYRPILGNGFLNAKGRQRCIELLTFCGDTHNAKHPKNPVVKLEVLKREWDFVHDRRDPNYGKTLETITVTLDRSTGVMREMQP